MCPMLLRGQEEESKSAHSFSEMNITDDINESNFGGVRGSKAKLR